jgi:hypothetical protein
MDEVARMGRANRKLAISDADGEQLRTLVRPQSISHPLVRRAQIVLLSGEGRSNRQHLRALAQSRRSI